MADEMVARAQRFINSYNVAGIPKVEEDGKTGWPVMYALTRALQYELGVSALSDNFGPATLAALQSTMPVIDTSSRLANINRIVQSGLYCKGYDGSGVSGTFDDQTSASVTTLKSHMGVAGAFPGGGVTPKVFKALLNMDAYITIGDGTDQVRQIQQWMNGRYIGHTNFFIMPCDGSFSRDVQKALVYAIQFELGISDGAATGALGPTTKNGLKSHELTVGSSGIWVLLFSAAMVFNKRPAATWTSLFDTGLANLTGDFQDFVALSRSEHGDYQTWCSLLVSTGDNTRRGRVADCVTTITQARAQALKTAGYDIVGRYLCNTANSTLNKMIQPGELDTIVAAGLSVFPIYQTLGGSLDYFSYDQGVSDAWAALSYAKQHGFRSGTGTRIYFSVDFDALGGEVDSNIIPHFRGIASVMNHYGVGYETGIYGPRNICSMVAAESLTSGSFVSDMSTGYSGNLGFPMPIDWTFDQISTVTVGSGSGSIQIDNDIASGRDVGQRSLIHSALTEKLDVPFDMSQMNALRDDIRAWFESVGIPEWGGGLHSGLITERSNTEVVDVAMSFDPLITRLARTLRMRKALIYCPLMWELRWYSYVDTVTELTVRGLWVGGDAFQDCSVGLGQIFANTGIGANNHALNVGLIGGKRYDADNQNDLWEMWNKLDDDDNYNVSMVPLVLIDGAYRRGARQPDLDYSDEENSIVLASYNGSGDAAAGYGEQLVGLHRLLERYFSPMRNA